MHFIIFQLRPRMRFPPIVDSGEMGIAFPPSSNWYQTNACTWLTESIFAYVAKRWVVVVRDGEGEKKGPIVQDFFIAHEAKVNCIAHLASNLAEGDEISFITASGEGVVRLWRFRGPSSFAESGTQMQQEHRHHRGESVSAVATSSDGTLALSGDITGRLVVWDLASPAESPRVLLSYPAARRAVRSAGGITALAFSPATTVAAVGYKNGQVITVDCTESSSGILSHFCVHRAEIHSLAFQPETPTLLLSSSRDCKMIVWNSVSREVERTFELPEPGGGAGRDKHKSSKLNSFWFSATWVSPSDKSAQSDNICILSSGFRGEILAWEWPAKGDKAEDLPKPRLFSASHLRPIYALVLHPSGSRLLSLSVDRNIAAWDIHSASRQWTLPGLGAFVNDLAVSPHSPHLVAIASEECIRLWTTGNRAQPYEHKSLWKGLKTRVCALDWCQEIEGLIGYGCDDGTLGTINTFTNEYAATTRAPHVGPVVKVQWRLTRVGRGASPCPVLYSVGNGKLMETTTGTTGSGEDGTLSAVSASLNRFFRCGGELRAKSTKKKGGQEVKISNFDMKGSIIAVGYFDGAVRLFQMPEGSAHDFDLTKSFPLLAEFHDHLKLVSALSWCRREAAPGSSEDEKADYQHWLATADCSGLIKVYDTKALVPAGVDDDDDDGGEVASKGESSASSSALASLSASIAHFPGHKAAVSRLAWSPVVRSSKSTPSPLSKSLPPPLLASCSFDGTAQMWDVSDSKPVANFRGHLGHVISLTWSHTQRRTLLTGSEDQSIRLWEAKTSTYLLPPSVPLFKQRRSKKGKKGKKGKQSKTESNPALDMGGKKGGVALSKRTKVKSLMRTVDKGAAKGEKRNEILLQEAIALVESKLTSPAKPSASTPGGSASLFWDRDAALALLRGELHSRSKGDDFGAAAHLAVWAGETGRALDLVVRSGKLTAKWVALAPSAGIDVWRALTRLYALQLEDEGDLHGAVLFHLSIQDVHGAIKVYETHKLFKDAIALARARLPPSDPVIAHLFAEWGGKLSASGDHASACRAFSAAGDPLSAASSASKVADCTGAMATAVKLSTSHGDFTCVSWAMQAVGTAVEAGEIKSAVDILNLFPASSLRFLVFPVIVEASIMNFIAGRDESRSPVDEEGRIDSNMWDGFDATAFNSFWGKAKADKWASVLLYRDFAAVSVRITPSELKEVQTMLDGEKSADLFEVGRTSSDSQLSARLGFLLSRLLYSRASKEELKQCADTIRVLLGSMGKKGEDVSEVISSLLLHWEGS